MASSEEGSQVPLQAKGSWSGFLKSLASFNGDLSTMTAPPFILSSTSLVEYASYWAEHPSVFIAPANEPDPKKRAMLVLKWFLTTLKQQFSSRNEKLGSEKKPLNPFLGEVFRGQWVDQAGVTELLSEQVSHHPPVTAYSIWNNQHGVRLQGYNAQKASFSRRIDVKQIGHSILYLQKYNEYYFITLPALHIEGLITGSPFVELNKSSFIQSSTGYTAKVDYSGRGWLSGKKNSFSAVLYPEGHERDAIYTVEGQWTGEFQIRDAKSKGTLVESWNGKTAKVTPLKVAPLDQQDPLETRRAWKKVADAIGKGDMNLTSAEKSTIENWQRSERKKEKDEGREWERTFFSRSTVHPQFDALARKIGEAQEIDKTNGVWEFDEKKYAAAKSPWKPGFVPM